MCEPVFAALDATADGLGASLSDPRMLGAVCFVTDIPAAAGVQNGAPMIAVPMAILDGARAVGETWRGSGACTQGRRGALRFRHDEELLFGAIAPTEACFSSADTTETPLQRCAQAAYRDMLGLITELGYPHLYRIWNYLPDIIEVLQEYWNSSILGEPQESIAPFSQESSWAERLAYELRQPS